MALLQTHRLPGLVGPRRGERAVSDFKGRHFEGEVVLWAVRWYCRYGVSYRDLEQMLGERALWLTTARSTAGSRSMCPRWRSGYAGIGACHARRVGGWARLT